MTNPILLRQFKHFRFLDSGTCTLPLEDEI